MADWELPALASATNGLPSAVVYHAPNSRPIADAILKIRAVNMGRLIQQLADLVVEDGDSERIYKCASGRHDDLGISCAMLAWAARHPHLSAWVDTALFARRPRKPRQTFGWNAFT
jgi:hypothetical protein